MGEECQGHQVLRLPLNGAKQQQYALHLTEVPPRSCEHKALEAPDLFMRQQEHGHQAEDLLCQFHFSLVLANAAGKSCAEYNR